MAAMVVAPLKQIFVVLALDASVIERVVMRMTTCVYGWRGRHLSDPPEMIAKKRVPNGKTTAPGSGKIGMLEGKLDLVKFLIIIYIKC